METSISFVIVIMMLIFGGTTLILARVANVVTDFKAVGNGVADDTKAFEQAWATLCASTDPSNNLIIPSPKTFLLHPFDFHGPCQSNITVQVMGSIVAPKKSDEAVWTNHKDHWLSFSYVNNLIVSGTSTGSISGSASKEKDDWWYCKTGEQCDKGRPTGLKFHQCNNCKVIGLNSRNPPRNHLSINECDGVTVDHVNFQAPENSPNTDGIDISASENVNIYNSFIGTGDDCIAINNGSSFINITGLNCGPGHGISVGSLGGKGDKPEIAKEIHVKNCTFNGTQNGARIKTFDGGSGFATRITFEHIALVNAGNPILIDQHYCPHGNCPHPPKSNAVEVSFVTFKDVTGTTSAKEAIDLSCSSFKHCHNIVLDHIDIKPLINTGIVKTNCTNVDGLISINTVLPPVTCAFTTSPATATEGFISMPVVDQDATDEEDHSEL